MSLLGTADEKLLASTDLDDANLRNGKGLPLMEIREELDGEGNVICG